jgi:hypothetical protein
VRLRVRLGRGWGGGVMVGGGGAGGGRATNCLIAIFEVIVIVVFCYSYLVLVFAVHENVFLCTWIFGAFLGTLCGLVLPTGRVRKFGLSFIPVVRVWVSGTVFLCTCMFCAFLGTFRGLVILQGSFRFVGISFIHMVVFCNKCLVLGCVFDCNVFLCTRIFGAFLGTLCGLVLTTGTFRKVGRSFIRFIRVCVSGTVFLCTWTVHCNVNLCTWIFGAFWGLLVYLLL